MPWVSGIAQGLGHATGCMGRTSVALDVYRVLGVCTHTKAVRPGLLAEGTMPEIKSKLAQILTMHGYAGNNVNEILEAVWRDNQNHLHPESFTIKPIVDRLPELFRTLKSRNFKIAICTADNRSATMSTLKYLNLLRFVDAVVCGDDADSKPKPNPYNAIKLRRELDAPPRRACVVGDTVADLRMGLEAGLTARIGVLSGVGTREYSAPFATHVIDDVGDLESILIGDQSIFEKSISRYYQSRIPGDQDYQTSFICSITC